MIRGFNMPFQTCKSGLGRCSNGINLATDDEAVRGLNDIVVVVHSLAAKIRIGCLTPAFSGAHKWAGMLRNPRVLGGPQQRGQNQNWLHVTYFYIVDSC